MDINNYENQTFYDKFMWILTVCWICSTCIFATRSYGVYILIGITAVMLLAYLIAHDMKIYFELGPFHIMIVLFAIYCFFSSLWAWDGSAAITKGVTILEILVCVSALYLHYQEQNDVWQIANAIKWSGFIVVIYAFYSYGIDTIRTILSESVRLDNEFDNVNTIAMLGAIAVCITCYELLFRKHNWIAVIMCIPCIVMIAASGSRKALIMLGMGVIFCLIFRFSNKNIISSCFRIALILLICYFVFRFLLSLELFSGIMERMEGLTALITGSGQVDSSASARSAYIQVGLNQFYKNPMVGIGIGSSGVLLQQTYGNSTYLHNNFVELLCCGGIVGFLLYYSMYIYIGYKLLKSKLKDPLSKLCFIILVIYLVMDYGMVSYFNKLTYIYFLLYFLQVRNVMITEMNETENANLGGIYEDI